MTKYRIVEQYTSTLGVPTIEYCPQKKFLWLFWTNFTEGPACEAETSLPWRRYLTFSNKEDAFEFLVKVEMLKEKKYSYITSGDINDATKARAN
jgi:hypothetical protein